MEKKNGHNYHLAHGVTIIRFGIGVLFIIFGTTKIAGGVQTWESLGNAMGYLGITFAPLFWGLCATGAELLGGLLLAINRHIKLATLLISCVMIVALVMQLSTGKPFSVYSHCITILIVMLGLFIDNK